MSEAAFRTALIVGVGSGLSASVARLFNKAGMKLALGARRAESLSGLAQEIGAKAFVCNAANADDVAKSIAVSAYGGFLVAQEAVKRMLPHRRGVILFTGASASVKGYAQSAPFAMGKFALRGLAQSMARELSPQGIHVAHIVIDGGIRSASRQNPPDRPDGFLDPDAIAQTYLHLVQQHRSAWAWEVELRPWIEKF